MPLDASIPLQSQYKPVDINQPIQMATGLQALQNARLQNQIGQQTLQQTTNNTQLSNQLQTERTALTSAMQDPKAPFKNDDGTIDYPKLQNWAATNTPLIGTQYADKIQQAAQNVNLYKTSLSQMSNSDMDRTNAVLHSFMGPNGTPITDPKSMIDQLQNIKRTLSGPGSGYVDAAIKSIQSHSDTPQNLQTAIGQLARDTTSPSTQATQQNVQMVNNGAMQVPVAANAEFGQAPGTLTGTPGIPQQLPPDARQTVGQNPVSGAYNVTSKDANGNVIGVSNAPTQGVYQPQPGDAQALPVLAAERDAARQAYNAAPLQHTNNKIVLDNIDSVLATGNSGNAWRNITSAFGMNPGSADKDGKFDPATAYDLVGKGLERSALQAAQSMGPQTNAGLAAQVAANGSTHYTPAAIKEVVKLNDAVTTGAQSYQPGLERAIAANPSAGVFAKRQFDQQWGDNFDPVVFQYYNAIKNGDTAGQAEILKKLGGTGSKGYNAMIQKAKNLQSLSNTGSLPQQ